MATEFAWEAPPLDAADRQLVEAYLSVGRTLDQLAYTDDFEKIVAQIDASPTDESRHRLLMRLLRLRKMGRLPRLGMLVEESTGLS
jgi:hypothetical protein